MRVNVRYLGLARSKLGKQEDEVELREGALLSELLDRLRGMYGEPMRRILDAGGESALDPSSVVTVNGLSHVGNPRLSDGDQVAIMTLISGG